MGGGWPFSICPFDKFGREPGPDDPVFFDPEADTPVPLELTGLMDEVVGPSPPPEPTRRSFTRSAAPD